MASATAILSHADATVRMTMENFQTPCDELFLTIGCSIAMFIGSSGNTPCSVVTREYMPPKFEAGDGYHPVHIGH